ALAHYDEQGHMVVHSSTQHPSETQEIVARVLGVPKNQVTCQSLRMGGAFGGKEVQANLWAAVAALAVRKTGRPVRVRLDRLRDFTMTGKRHPFLARYEVGFDDSGKVAALRVNLFSDGGYSLDLSKPVLYRAMFHIDNCYRIPHLRVTGRICKTHRTSQTAFRGFGGPQGMVAIEEVMDHVARLVDAPPHEVRARNFYEPGDRTHYGQVVKDADRIRRIWDDLLRESNFEERWKATRLHNGQNPDMRRGLAITPVKFGISFTAKFYNQGGALVLVYKDGTVQVNHGGTEMGQGLHTKMLQIAAHAFGIGMDRIRLMPTRTDKVPNTSATAASAGTDLNGAAVKNACDDIKTRLASFIGSKHDVPDTELLFEGGRVTHPATGLSLSFEEVVKAAYFERIQLFSTGFYRTPGIAFDEGTGKGTPFHYFAYGAAVTEVEVDRFTGQYRFLRTDILHDVGDSLSPLIDMGQVEGGYIQGLGWLTQEELVWDDKGRLRTGNASTYKLPSLGECPPEFHVRLLPKAAEPGVIHGSKAVGEPPLMLAISAREALRDAVALPNAQAPLACPSTAEAVYWALEPHR
ncbi:MAG: molybdopterin-dependent oxidoreductase, partial [Myxococcales bacterium]|nr:molybdopterin-dependent oxidoreductase [Myxococcales bacterium]